MSVNQIMRPHGSLQEESLHVCRNVVEGDAPNAYALVRPPGHHASAERSMGFCLFNNAGLAAHDTVKERETSPYL